MKNSKFKQVLMSAAFGVATLVSASALADVVVVVSAKSSVGNLTSEQVSQIFLGKANSFPDGSVAVPIDQAEDAKAHNEFYSKVTGKSATQLRMHWSNIVFSGKGKPPKEVAGNADVRKLVAENPNLIGYIDKNTVDGSVKVVLAP